MTRKGVALPPLFSAEQQPEALTEELHVHDIDTRGASVGGSGSSDRKHENQINGKIYLSPHGRGQEAK